MEGKRFIHSLQLQNFLSYGSEGETIELQPLNVLIGSNASGKSNLIEAIALLKATPTDLVAPIRQGGGISDFLWKGEKGIPTAKIEAILDYPERSMPLRYKISFTAVGQRLEVVDEAIEDIAPRYSSENAPFFYYHYIGDRGRPVINVTEDNKQQPRNLRTLRREDIVPDQSILSQRKDPEQYPELSYLGNEFADIGLYRNWQTGRDSVSRKAQQTDLPEHPLLEDGGNLGLILNNLQYQLGSRQIIEKLKLFYDTAEELSIKIYGGTVQIFIRETGLIQPIPATRLSDGTLRYLFLIALLLDPTPPPLICIEEPEIGLHPDILPAIAEMLIEASQRTQLIVTTHSDALVSALSPESVLICDRDDRGSHLSRLDPERLKKWLENYTLGDLWRRGEIGGNR
ncbi:AAA family ATPase [Lyngbya sp. CCAP 1446/10]|uniref:AAA family ATPase n=1 Tax=Lyngbya sp. CCAP 1446/10 TaxID=439293 RepID=UPI0022375F5E|nr:AAA family ATPase [Lyngbya sp. CCAP 1446/10]MCW6049042.1 AAA family ATPase [Lyngbya sp. CCAP 1446/10]